MEYCHLFFKRSPFKKKRSREPRSCTPASSNNSIQLTPVPFSMQCAAKHRLLYINNNNVPSVNSHSWQLFPGFILQICKSTSQQISSWNIKISQSFWGKNHYTGWISKWAKPLYDLERLLKQSQPETLFVLFIVFVLFGLFCSLLSGTVIVT